MRGAGMVNVVNIPLRRKALHSTSTPQTLAIWKVMIIF